jgi:hypothetical protein
MFSTGPVVRPRLEPKETPTRLAREAEGLRQTEFGSQGQPLLRLTRRAARTHVRMVWLPKAGSACKSASSAFRIDFTHPQGLRFESVRGLEVISRLDVVSVAESGLDLAPLDALGEEVLPGPVADCAFGREVRACPDRAGSLSGEAERHDQPVLVTSREVAVEELGDSVHSRPGHLGYQAGRRTKSEARSKRRDARSEPDLGSSEQAPH